MKKLLALILAVSFLGTGAARLAAADAGLVEATVTKVTGMATYSVAGGAAQPVVVGTKLPQGAHITTGENSQLTIQAHDGIVAVAGAKTDITVEQLSVAANGTRTATIALKSGNLASSLDPAKKQINNYSVRTPKGVAAARGTTYSVAYDGVIYSVTVVAGVVQSFSMSGASVNVQVGQVTSSSDGQTATSQTLAEAVASNSSAADGLALLAASVASVSTNVSDVAAVINTIASQAGTGQAATNAVATATAAAAATAATNENITSSGGGATATAAAIVGAAVNGSAAAGNTAAAGAIVATTTVAVSTTTGASVESVATTLTNTANSTAGVSVSTQAVVNAANTSIQSGNTAATTTTIIQIEQPTPGGTDTTLVEAPIVTPITPVVPDITVSGSN